MGFPEPGHIVSGQILIGGNIRDGTQAYVYEATNIITGDVFAAKVIYTGNHFCCDNNDNNEDIKQEYECQINDDNTAANEAKQCAEFELRCLDTLQLSQHVLKLHTYIKTPIFTLLLLDRAQCDLYDFHPNVVLREYIFLDTIFTVFC